MPRRKKGFKNLKFASIGILLIIGTWFAAGYYYDNSRKPEPQSKPEPAVQEAASEKTEVEKPQAKDPNEEQKQFQGTMLRLVPYNSKEYGFELQYPVSGDTKSQCPPLAENDSGFSVGIFSFLVSNLDGKLLMDYVKESMAGMNIDNESSVTVGGLPAIKLDYQTTGMGFNGSTVFVEKGGKVYEFGLLVNEAPAKCAGSSSYEDEVYQSVISTLKFADQQ